MRTVLASILAWLVAGTALAFALVRLLGIESGFPLFPILAFTPYVAVAAVLCAIVLLLLRHWAAAAVTVIAAAVLVALVIPRAVGESAEPGGNTLRVMTSNMFLGGASAEALIELVAEHEVDVLSVQEVTPRLATRLEAAGIADELPHQLLAPGSESSGGALYSRLPLREIRDVPSSLAGPLPAGSIQPAQGPAVSVYVVHPPPPIDGTRVAELAADLETIPSAGGSEQLTVIAGDFNSTIDNAALRDVLARGYIDAAETTGAGLIPTWPAGRVFPPQVTVDHVLVDERASMTNTQIFNIAGSDHRAVLAELSLPTPR